MKSSEIIRYFVISILAIAFFALCFFTFVQGFPLPDQPSASEVASITLSYNDSENDTTTEITDSSEISTFLYGAFPLCYYRIIGTTEGSSIIDIVYTLTDGSTLEMSVNETTVWWNGKAYPLMDKGAIVEAIETLYLNN
ncbi:MAG: hypothetical protein K6G40_10220 [Eubacterium sp.]|nr:hypothetical protein [Eubacterium sp.]